jgi:hypothetical protein
MTAFHAEQSAEPFPFVLPVEEEPVPAAGPAQGRGVLPAGWQRLPVRLRGARVYRVTPPDGRAAYWHAEMKLNGTVQCRRCASELYALWWIAALKEPPSVPEIFEMVELDAPLQRGNFRHG